MGKRLISLLTCALCAIAMCLALLGCGGSDTSKMVGYWELVSGTADGTELTEEEVSTLSELDLRFILHLGDDGTATLDMFGGIEDMTWDKSKATMKYGGKDGTFTLSGDTLTYSAGDEQTLIFKKGDDSLAENDRKSQDEAGGDNAASGSSAAVTSVAIEPAITIVDDKVATITATARVVDENGMAGIMYSITNNGDSKVGMHMLDDSTVNGGTYENYFYASVEAGETANEICAFDGLSSVDELVKIHSELLVYDSMSFAEIATYDIDIP